jgi:hypothetical protein
MHVHLYSFVLEYVPYYPLLQNELWIIGSYSNIRYRLHNAVYHFIPLHIVSAVMSAVTSTTIPSIAVASVSNAVAVVTPLVEGDAGFLDFILDQLCALSDEAAVKEGKAKGNSIFKLSTLKQIAKKMGLIVGIPKPDMIIALRSAVLRATELKDIEASKRDGTYTVDKNTVPRLVNLVLRYPDALQRSSALATRQDLQNKEVNGTRLIWVTVAEEFMDGGRIWRSGEAA